MGYILPIVLAVIIFLRISKLNHKVESLQEQILEMKKQSGSNYVNVVHEQPVLDSQIASSDVDSPVLDNIVQNQTRSKTITVSNKPETESNFVIWMKENTLLKIGILMFLAGFGWFVSYAFAQQWIGPVGRITLGIVTGALVMIFGTYRLGKNETQGIAFSVLGSALVVVSLLSGQYIYNFFSSGVALGLIFIVSLYIALISIAYSTEKLAVYGVLLSLLAPFFSHSTNMDLVNLYLYLGAVSFAIIWVSVFKKWTILNQVGITGILFYGLPNFASGGLTHYNTKYFILFTQYAISLLYLGVGVWGLVRNKLKAGTDDLYLAIVNTVIILGFTTAIVPAVYQSLTIAGWMLVYTFSGFFVFQKTKNEKLFYVHSLIAVFLLAIATSIELSGQTLVIAFAIEAAVISIGSFVVTGKIRTAEAFAGLLIVPFMMSQSSIMSSKWNVGIIHSDFAVLLVLVLVTALLGVFYRMNKGSDTSSDIRAHQILFIISSFYIYALVWLCSHSIIKDNDSAVFVSLFVYTIIGLITHFYGLFNHNVVLKKYGMTLLVLVVIRLILVDVWNMELMLRVITFIVLGIMFMSTAFMSRNQKAIGN
ncbi:MAG: DUF2339 domain-containing protein [Nitrospira sp.]